MTKIIFLVPTCSPFLTYYLSTYTSARSKWTESSTNL